MASSRRLGGRLAVCASLLLSLSCTNDSSDTAALQCDLPDVVTSPPESLPPSLFVDGEIRHAVFFEFSSEDAVFRLNEDILTRLTTGSEFRDLMRRAQQGQAGRFTWFQYESSVGLGEDACELLRELGSPDELMNVILVDS